MIYFRQNGQKGWNFFSRWCIYILTTANTRTAHLGNQGLEINTMTQAEITQRAKYELTQRQLLELKKKKTNHLLHIFLTICTAGLWLPCWIFAANQNSSHNSKLEREITGEKDWTSIVTWLVIAALPIALIVATITH